MNNYKASDKRISIDTPKSIIENGVSNFGTFNTPFEDLNLLNVHHQSKCLPDFMNRFRLTEWEAFEVNLDIGCLVCAVYNNMNLMGMGIIVFYNKEEDKIYTYKKMTLPCKVSVCKTLLSSTTKINLKNFKLEINNNFENGEAKINADVYNKKNGSLKLDFKIKRVSKPSIVSIPLGKNKPLYTEKDIFSVQGNLTFNERICEANDKSVAIIDDHKGYYPYKAHYDWLTTMIKLNIDGKEQYFGFNLTKNQSLNEDDYNENLIWTENETYPLPPVKFTHDGNSWKINDEYGLVNLKFTISQTFKMMMHLGILDISYYLPFGKVSGTLKTIEGKEFILNEEYAIGEDKSTRL